MESHRLTRVQTPLERPEITELARGEGRREHRWVQLQRGLPPSLEAELLLQQAGMSPEIFRRMSPEGGPRPPPRQTLKNPTTGS